MALLLNPDENFEISCAACVEKGRHNGIQVHDVRISVTGYDTAPQSNSPTFSIEVVKTFAQRFNTFLNQVNLDENLREALLEMETELLTELNQRFGNGGRTTFKRFIIFGLEPSIESLMAADPSATRQVLH